MPPHYGRLTPAINELVVFSVASYPKPDDVGSLFYSQSAIMRADANGSELSYAFEMKRGMAGIVLEKLEVTVGKTTNRFRKLVVISPEL